jgi:hypothetical protein
MLISVRLTDASGGAAGDAAPRAQGLRIILESELSHVADITAGEKQWKRLNLF